ncbi:alpha-amylase family glycosyl hydrolase [Deinococcus maricopensis]|uniref:Cyclomaltodextrin glucanotransferase n=1 Tax=Deinococcus maricopensis (strain DSM 21211 / LMG 22137 / NRRL B-23946 / LB-34) TaxID=709986 RepID=E8U5C8_DEIML|nr:alpha-amylase family glycosyl hydrolase [Deinococcus maricopensis]ADV66267.1 Cyclomaltodextrin glucanotransferase [Deinococcus maricopensis DSM 21211]
MPRTLITLLSSALLLAACGQPTTPATHSSLTTQALSGTTIDTWRKQVIYLALPDRFSNGNTGNDSAGQPNCFDRASATKFHGGDLQGLRSKLGYLRDLGATTLWLTPVYKQVGLVNGNSCGYHGYWPDYTNPNDTAIEPKLGTASDLTGLISDLHAGGQKFMMDMVANHAGYGARIVTQQPGWFHNNCTGDDVNCPLAGLPDFRQEDSAVAAYLTGLSQAWTSAYAIDGIRMDTAKHVPLNYWQTSWVPGVLQTRPNTFLLAEAFLDGSASQLRPFLDAGFDSTFAFPTRSALVSSVARNGSLDLLAGKVQDTLGTLGLNRALLQVNLLDNHDVQRFLNEPGYGVPETDIRARYSLALTALMTIPGIPQLYYGDELGMYGGNDPDNRRDMPAWAWTDAGRATAQSGYLAGGGTPKTTYDLTKQLIGIRTGNEALWKGGYAELWRPNGGQNALAFYRSSGASRMVVVLNLSDTTANLPLDLQGNGGISSTDKTYLVNGRTFTDLLGRGAPATTTVSGGKLNVSVPARTAAIYRAN